jgi:hypothetical protein
MSGTNWTTFTVPVSGTLSTKPNNIAVKNTGRANPDIYFSTQDSMYKMDDMAGTNLVRYSGAGTNKFINIGGFGLKP